MSSTCVLGLLVDYKESNVVKVYQLELNFTERKSTKTHHLNMEKKFST